MKYLIVLIAFIPMKLFSQHGEWQVYITPRYPSYGFGDNGVFRFKLNQSNVITPLVYSSYNTEISCLDSLNELIYKSCHASNLKSLLNEVLDHNMEFRRPRIVIFRSLECDTIMIDENHLVKIDDKIFQLNDTGVNFFYSLMPLDIKLNWLLGKKEMKTTDVEKLKSMSK